MRIFESAGYWYVSGSNVMYDSYEEAKMASDKLEVLMEVQGIVNELNKIDELLTYINSNGYGVGQSNAFTDDDALQVKANLAAADVSNALNLLSQVNTLMTNGTPVEGDYTSIVDKFRSRT